MFAEKNISQTLSVTCLLVSHGALGLGMGQWLSSSRRHQPWCLSGESHPPPGLRSFCVSPHRARSLCISFVTDPEVEGVLVSYLNGISACLAGARTESTAEAAGGS